MEKNIQINRKKQESVMSWIVPKCYRIGTHDGMY